MIMTMIMITIMITTIMNIIISNTNTHNDSINNNTSNINKHGHVVITMIISRTRACRFDGDGACRGCRLPTLVILVKYQYCPLETHEQLRHSRPCTRCAV